MQAGPLDSAGMQAGPLSSAGMQAGPLSSAGMQAGPLSSAVSRQVPPQSSAVPPQSSAVSRPAPPSRAVSRPAPPSSAVPPSRAVSRPAPLSSAVFRPVPPSSAVSRPVPPSSAVSRPVPPSSAVSSDSIKCALCSEDVQVEGFTEHLSDYHVEECCEQCGSKVWGVVGLLHHIDKHHLISLSDQERPSVNPPEPSPTTSTAYVEEQQGAPQITLNTPSLRPPEVNWVNFLPKQFCRVIKPADQKWIAQCLYESTGRLKQQFSQNWFHPPSSSKLTASPPDPGSYFRQRMFLWAPMRMWGIPLKCTQCNRKMHHSGIYTKVREVIDVDSRYYLIGADYPPCSKCMIPVCPWSSEILKQLDPSHRNKFPAVLMTHLALDRKCVTLLKPRTAGNSSSYLQQALEEIYSEEWARRTVDYLTDCELHKKRCALTQLDVVYDQPPPFCPLPLAQWFETAHANEILNHLDELKGVITSTYGVTPVLTWFRPWKVTVRLDVFHFMRRFTAGLTTEHHPLYGTFCSKLSSCIFEWDKDDISRLKEAKKTMLLKKHGGHILSSITSNELAKHCRRRTRGVEETRALIHGLLDSMWELTDTTGLHLINPESMAHVQEVQQKHLPCIQDPPDVQLYTKLGSGLQKGDKILDVLRCGRGSSSLESFHRHQCTFIPDERVAVEYLLAQSDRGDLLSPLVHGEITPPETQEVEVQEDECLDVTICDAADINLEAHTLSSSSSHDDSLISSLTIYDPWSGCPET
ncbi:Carboxyl-terminal PDZ ligand of neuronal nitric oxide synthase [Labeo rohita]|uniref:Carboxyl-terminal PDZ ligand of neuronal nitric oxide synthase n=1 Tax=Labeo rohita TaxID=84645 RepID=A0A498LTV7_LABRO|nr:Carboxyl-terminal PDZ ligand of neuronal nitric oxide synthase [Labeo rohita]